ncbi:MAG: EscU/YscU/HrcU family type III secretion system export apparatus switch protein [Planctomycetales bacterium]|nr:EscU/YscU/HrcU family type III secretion system export apparatus switch protein [Planctomycetales bacterium]
MSDRQHEPTTRRLREARRAGDVPFSAELARALTLLGGLAALAWLSAPLARAVMELAESQFVRANPLRGGLAPDGERLTAVLFAALPPLAGLLAFAWIASGAQRRFAWTPSRLKVDVSQLSPAANWSRIWRKLDEWAASCFKSPLLLAAAAWVVYREAPQWAGLSLLPPEQIAAASARVAARLALQLALLMTALGTLDYLWQRWRYRRNLRMTEQEVRQSHREEELSPEIRARRRSLHRRLS